MCYQWMKGEYREILAIAWLTMSLATPLSLPWLLNGRLHLGFWFTRSNHINLTCQGAVSWCGTHLPATEHMFDGSKGWLLLLQGKNQLLCLPVLQDDGIPFGEGLWGFIECHFSVDLKQEKYMKGKSHEIKHWTQRTSRESEANVPQPKKESVC